MPQFLVAIHHPDNYDPGTEDRAMALQIDALNDEMVEAGIRIFVGGLHSASTAKHILPDGDFKLADGPFVKASEHVGGFWVLELANMAEACAWGQKAAKACKAPVEVRQFHGSTAQNPAI